MIKAVTNLREWQTIIDELPCCDIFYHPSYANVFAQAKVNKEFSEAFSGEPMLIYYEDDGGKIIHPVFKRKVLNTGFYDIISPYGYSGPLPFSKPNLPNYLEQLQDFCLKERMLSEFARLHPFFNNVLPSSIKKSRVVWVNLANDKDALLRQFSKPCRNAIANAERKGVTIFFDDLPETMNVLLFEELYNRTMLRNNASQKYFFSLDFFNKLFLFLRNHFLLVSAQYQGRIISMALFLTYKDFIHYYLAGSEPSFKVNANNLILKDAILWAKEKGFKKMNLGGGYDGEDSLFQFKQSFSPLTADFYVHQKVHMPEQYNYLSRNKNMDFFPAYRG